VIDLHTHSRLSDGSDPPAEIVRQAAKAGCSAVALTDHDRLDGLAEAHDAGTRVGIEVISGVEISCMAPTEPREEGAQRAASTVRTEATPDGLHLLGYLFDPGDDGLKGVLAELRDDRAVRNRAMLARLADVGIRIDEEELRLEAGGDGAGGDGAGRPHLAAILVRRGHALDVEDAFRRWLAPGRPGFVPKARLSPQAAIARVRAAGGVTALAHPLGRAGLAPDVSGLADALGPLVEAGLDGLESHYAAYDTATRRDLTALARTLGLVPTGGSDFHGRYKPGLSVGRGRGDLVVPDSVLIELRERATTAGGRPGG